MHAPQRPTHSPLLLVIIATLPLILAAVSILMVKGALEKRANVNVEPGNAPASQTISVGQ